MDEFTGRLMPGRRWSDGLHQAIEARERAEIQSENQTLASITFQNYFRLYQKLAGMTGTADTEAYEFQEIYNLETAVIPTHMPMVRADRLDQVYKTESREGSGGARGHQGLLFAWPARARGYDLDRELGKTGGAAEQRRAFAPGIERETACVRGADHRGGWTAENDHDRHQHGRSRYRHRPRRECRKAGGFGQGRSEPQRGRQSYQDSTTAGRVAKAPPAGRRGRRIAYHRHGAPRVPAHRQPIARPLRPPRRPGIIALLLGARRFAAANFCRRAHQGHHGTAEDARG